MFCSRALLYDLSKPEVRQVSLSPSDIFGVGYVIAYVIASAAVFTFAASRAGNTVNAPNNQTGHSCNCV